MWHQLLVALLLSMLTVLIHSSGSYSVFLWVTRYLSRHPQPSLIRGWWVLVRFVVYLLLLHAVEVAVWAQFYVFMHWFSDSGTAYYYSLSSYTTVGYGDVVLARPWRFMGAWEAMLGVLMFGWSTASLAALLHHFHEIRLRHLLSNLGA
jgi:hypothetical protein